MKVEIKNKVTELQALENALQSLNLHGYTVHKDVTRKAAYFLRDPEGYSLTGCWDYVRLNHFIMGYGKAHNMALNLHEELREALRKQYDRLLFFEQEAELSDQDKEIVNDMIQEMRPYITKNSQ